MTDGSRGGNRVQPNHEGNIRQLLSTIDKLSNAISPRPTQSTQLKSDMRHTFASSNNRSSPGGERNMNLNRPSLSSSLNTEAEWTTNRYRPYSVR